MFLIDDLLLAPVTGLIWLGRRLEDAARAEVYDETRLRAQLLDLQDRWMLGEVTDEVYEQEEEQLLLLMEEARQQAT